MRFDQHQRSAPRHQRGLGVIIAGLALLGVPATVVAQAADPAPPAAEPGAEVREDGPVPFAASAVEALEPGGASVTEVAVRRRPEVGDFVSVFNSGALSSDTETRAINAATSAGAQFSIRGSASIAMQSVTRDGAPIQLAPAGMSIPMGTTVLDKSTVATLMGFEVAGSLDSGSIVMSELTASLRGARAGDVVTLRSSFGADVAFTIGAVVADQVTGGTELLIDPSAAARIGLDRKSGVIIWDFRSRDAINAALASAGLESTSIRIRRSWDAFDPDSTIGMARTKEALGEFGYRANSNGSVTVEDAWKAQNLSTRQYLPGITRSCHRVVEPQMAAAIDEVVARGLSGVFDVGDWRVAGGCYTPRFNRLTPNSTIGFLSRHTWGMAMDTNTVSACQGCSPPSFATRVGGCDVVRIFRKHGFAWGGNFLTPDGMHFEYVGERRDQFAYPSRWCANEVAGSAALRVETSQRGTMFADAGLVAHHDHGHDGHHDH
ncbi:MAG: M15 family metallopeptidase [Ilumatobacter sp.]